MAEIQSTSASEVVAGGEKNKRGLLCVISGIVALIEMSGVVASELKELYLE